MDGKFRLAFAETGKSPTGDVFAAEGCQTFDRLRDALCAAQKRENEWEMPYIAHKFIMLDPETIGVLYKELVAAS